MFYCMFYFTCDRSLNGCCRQLMLAAEAEARRGMLDELNIPLLWNTVGLFYHYLSVYK